MKKILFAIVMAASVNVFSNDTIAVDNSKIEKCIADTTMTTKGNRSVKHYIIYNGELVNTSKTVVDKIKLCKKYNVRCALVMVKSKSSRRIILN